MTDQNSTDTSAADTPVFRLQKLYVKDLSFENPNAPGVFFAKESEPKVDWEVTLSVTAKVTDNKSDKTLFIIEVEHAAAFMLKNIPDQHLPMVLAVECPTLMFPFTRQVISQASVDGGFIPFLLEPVNFLALYENSKKNQAEKQKKQQN